MAKKIKKYRTKLFCPECGHYIDNESFNYCANCGAKVLERFECICGKNIPKGKNFCPYCGRKYEEITEEMRENEARLDAILQKWGFSIPRTKDAPQVPIEKVKELVRELEEFIASLPPAQAEVCPKCGAELVHWPGVTKSVCPKCDVTPPLTLRRRR